MAQRQPVCIRLLLLEGAQHLFSKFSSHLGWGFQCPESGRSWELYVLEFHKNKVTLFSETVGVHSEVDKRSPPREKDLEPQDRQQTGAGDATDLSPHPGPLGPLSLGHTASGQAQQGAFSVPWFLPA